MGDFFDKDMEDFFDFVLFSSLYRRSKNRNNFYSNELSLDEHEEEEDEYYNEFNDTEEYY